MIKAKSQGEKKLHKSIFSVCKTWWEPARRQINEVINIYNRGELGSHSFNFTGLCGQLTDHWPSPDTNSIPSPPEGCSFLLCKGLIAFSYTFVQQFAHVKCYMLMITITPVTGLGVWFVSRDTD